MARFTLIPEIAAPVAEVLATLPAQVLADLLTDDRFTIVDYDATPGQPGQFPVPAPSRIPARTVVLKRHLVRMQGHFVRYVIAHELAHAHLRNAGRTPAEDPEHAADALAADWGHPKPSDWRTYFRR